MKKKNSSHTDLQQLSVIEGGGSRRQFIKQAGALTGIGLVLFASIATAQADRQQYDPVPEKITGSIGGSVPSDAIVLFDGSNMDAWGHRGGGRTCPLGDRRWCHDRAPGHAYH